MIGRIASTATSKTVSRLSGTAGVGAALASLAPTEPPFSGQISAQNIATDLAERTGAVRYPAVQVYCEKVVNGLKEKFRQFSGYAQMAVEVRHSQDRVDGLEGRVQLFVDAVLEALTTQKGDWGDGTSFLGGYEVAFGPVKHGGRNFLQTAKITFELEIGRN